MFASLRIATLACISLAVGALASPTVAVAQSTGMLPGGATLEFNQLYVQKKGDDANELSTLSGEDALYHFNTAHCECSRQQPGFAEGDFIWEIQLRNRTQTVTRTGEIWVGSTCSSDETTRNTNCTQLTSLAISDIDNLANSPARVRIPTFFAINPKLSASQQCGERVGDAFTWIGVDGDQDGALDYWNSKSVKVDTQPPPLPTDVKGVPGEGSVKMSWKTPTSRSTDVKVYQFFCATVDGSPARAKGSDSPEFQTVRSLCDIEAQSIPFASAGGEGDAPSFLANVDTNSAFICGEASGTATSTDLEGLTAGTPYRVAMVSVDPSGNAAGVYLPQPVVPTSVIDFWEDIHDQGSDVEGGFCLLARTYGDDSGVTRALRSFRDDTLARSAVGRWLTARYYEVSRALAPAAEFQAVRFLAAVLLAPLVALALLWHFATLPGGLAILAALLLLWRRRQTLGRVKLAPARAAVTAAAALALLVAGSRAASAQSMDPYWDDENLASSNAAEDEYEVTWHAGIRVGPYTPAIDAQFGGSSPGPYEQMFGGYGILPMLDVDYIFLETRLGQFGAGGSLGFFTKEAKAYEMGSLPGPDRPRSAEDNTFRMLPMAATGVFRLTYFDNEFRVPIVPYVRGGLAYYVWWVEKPNGNVASVCREGSMICDENKGRGGSLGLVGSIGLAVRAEAIDFEAASAMREGGILHAGFYAELSASKVDDFGTGNKLAVGDLTWFAGVDFEF
jgi:hypothetical protein